MMGKGSIGFSADCWWRHAC